MTTSYTRGSVRLGVAQLAVLWLLWFVLVSHPQNILDSHLPAPGEPFLEPDNPSRSGGGGGGGFNVPVQRLAPSPDVGRYIVYRGKDQRMGQGIGNLMNGVLAAHVMGEEFNRIVCVYWDDFELAFERTRYDDVCKKIPHDDDAMLSYPQIMSWNFGPSQHECQIVDVLSSPDMAIVSFNGNTYPKWPLVPNNFFDSYYAATPRLQSTLPWAEGQSPSVVVHLRKADGLSDSRKGLDTDTLQALGEHLPRNTTFLVTNNVQWYSYFSTHFGWQTPEWEAVAHSALKHIRWGSTESTRAKKQGDRWKQLETALAGLDAKQVQMMHLWSDWYTILRAQEVYHTHSDFSLSAIHWSNITSRTILGVEQLQSNKEGEEDKTDKDNDDTDDNNDNDNDDGHAAAPRKLVLEEEAWRRDGEMLPLRHRARANLTTRDGELCHTIPYDSSAVYPIRRKRHEFALLDAEELLEEQGMLNDPA